MCFFLLVDNNAPRLQLNEVKQIILTQKEKIMESIPLSKAACIFHKMWKELWTKVNIIGPKNRYSFLNFLFLQHGGGQKKSEIAQHRPDSGPHYLQSGGWIE